MSRATFPVSVKGVLFRAGKVVLLKNERHEWELPGGRLEEGESPEDCLAREFQEELGVTVAVGALLDTWIYEVLPGRRVLIVTYAVSAAPDCALTISHEHQDVGLFGLEELSALPMPQGYVRSIMVAHKLTP
jgi:mutator protein MutT